MSIPDKNYHYKPFKVKAFSLFKVEKQVDTECLVMYNNEIVKVGVFGVFWRQYTLALHASDRERK